MEADYYSDLKNNEELNRLSVCYHPLLKLKDCYNVVKLGKGMYLIENFVTIDVLRGEISFEKTTMQFHPDQLFKLVKKALGGFSYKLEYIIGRETQTVLKKAKYPLINSTIQKLKASGNYSYGKFVTTPIL